MNVVINKYLMSFFLLLNIWNESQIETEKLKLYKIADLIWYKRSQNSINLQFVGNLLRPKEKK